jgi:drug/metabolite transporter (DMT)-like permease
MTFRLAVLSLLLVTLIWSSTFAITKDTLETIPPALFLALRVTFGTLALLWVKPDRKAIRPGLILGLLSTGVGIFEILALTMTSASRVAFIVTFSFFIAPVISALVFKRQVPLKAYVALLIAIVGLAILILGDVAIILNTGDIFAFVAALFFGAYYAFTGEIDSEASIFYAVFCRSILVTLFAWVWAFPQLANIAQIPASGWFTLIYVGVVAGTLALVLQIRAQRAVPVYIMTLILALQPVFAAIIAFVWLGERFTLRALVGAAIVLVAILMVAVPSKSTYVNKELM